MAGVLLAHTLHFSLGYFFTLFFYILTFFSVKWNSRGSIEKSAPSKLTPTAISPLFFKLLSGYQTLLLLSNKQDYSIEQLQFFHSMPFLFVAALCAWLFSRFIWSRGATAEYNTILTALTWLILAMNSFVFVTDLFLFILALEVIAVVYYFFFLGQLAVEPRTFFKFKNLLSNYLWSGFFTIVLLFFALLGIVVANGSLTFVQICVAATIIPAWCWQGLAIALMWKIGAPGFFFFKLELYQYLPTINLIFFSLSSLFVNCFLLNFFFAELWLVYTWYNWGLLFYILIANLVLLMRAKTVTNFYQFLGFSAINTWATLLVAYLVKQYVYKVSYCF